MSGQPEALRLADVIERQEWEWSDVPKAAAELRRLHAESEVLKLSVARLQQHHATAWNRGHTMGMKANDDTARRALDAVKQDAWSNTQLTEALLRAEAQRDALMEALKELVGHNKRFTVEPVAWLWQHRETGRTRVLMPDERTATDVAAAWDVVGPLYLAPPQRKPLTEEEIRYALESEFLGFDEKRNWQDDLRVARAVERAHGITS